MTARHRVQAASRWSFPLRHLIFSYYAKGLYGALYGRPYNKALSSGGFQMVSLLHLAEITETGVKFQSPVCMETPHSEHTKNP